MKILRIPFVLIISVIAFSILFADEPKSEGLKKGDKMVDFGMRKVDVEKGKLSSLVWLGD